MKWEASPNAEISSLQADLSARRNVQRMGFIINWPWPSLFRYQPQHDQHSHSQGHMRDTQGCSYNSCIWHVLYNTFVSSFYLFYQPAAKSCISYDSQSRLNADRCNNVALTWNTVFSQIIDFVLLTVKRIYEPKLHFFHSKKYYFAGRGPIIQVIYFQSNLYTNTV